MRASVTRLDAASADDAPPAQGLVKSENCEGHKKDSRPPMPAPCEEAARQHEETPERADDAAGTIEIRSEEFPHGQKLARARAGGKAQICAEGGAWAQDGIPRLE